MNQSNQILYLILIAALSVFVGCEPTKPKSPNFTPAPVQKPKRKTLVSIKEGPRPTTIYGATFVDAHLFHEKEIADGKWVCIEGTVNHSGTTMGAPSVSVACLTCGTRIYCEGPLLDTFVIPKGIRVIIRGRVFHGRTLVESKPIVQNEIDAALKNDSNKKSIRAPESAASDKTK